jgi:hypothetical protein
MFAVRITGSSGAATIGTISSAKSVVVGASLSLSCGFSGVSTSALMAVVRGVRYIRSSLAGVALSVVRVMVPVFSFIVACMEMGLA